MVIFEQEGGGVVAGVDPRVRLAAVLALAVLLYLVPTLPAAGAALALATAAAVAARVPLARTLQRLLTFNLFFLVLALTLPLGVPGRPVISWGGLVWTGEGLLRAGQIALQANAVMLSAFALLATLDPSRLGAGLVGLGVPKRLAAVTALLVRYVEVFHQEYHRLADAARVKCFTPRFSRHTLTTMGFLVGQLLLRSIERGERILAAMRCRGFRGEFKVMTPPGLSASDGAFALVWVAGLALVGWIGWRPNP